MCKYFHISETLCNRQVIPTLYVIEMLSLNDERYGQYRSGYGIIYDVVPKIRELINSGPSKSFWNEIWEELYHQGDVGEASYAIVPYLVEYEESNKHLEENIYHFVVSVELASLEDRNPPIPNELQFSYAKGVRKLPYIGMNKLKRGCSHSAVMLVASAMAVSLGHTILGRSYLDFGPDDALTFLENEYGYERADHDV